MCWYNVIMSLVNRFHLDLDKDEEIKLVVPRGKIGIFLIWAGEILGMIAIAVTLIWMSSNNSHTLLPIGSDSRKYLNVLIYAILIILIISGLVGTVVYRGNRLVITNKRVIQCVTEALFATKLKIIGLESVEDVSSKKAGPLQQIFNFGTIQMSTDSDETSYIYTYVDNPTSQTKKISRIIREFKESKAKKSTPKSPQNSPSSKN